MVVDVDGFGRTMIGMVRKIGHFGRLKKEVPGTMLLYNIKAGTSINPSLHGNPDPNLGRESSAPIAGRKSIFLQMHNLGARFREPD
jgi:hypothetical protein